jgi:hypothetical protein
MHDANDLDAVGQLSVKDDVSPDRQQAQLFGDVGPGWTQPRGGGQQAELCVNRVEHSVGGGRVVGGDV